ncbi:MAG: MscL family protein [Clostridia bacterium]|nr:MscL family protein [Clostridia bacterium]
MKKFFEEFKKFITRGNVLDMAVGVIVGGAFTAIVNALSNNILKPIINYLLALILGKDSLSNIYTFLGDPAYQKNEAGEVIKDAITGEPLIDLANSFYIDWGAFINAIINFLLIALVLFSIVKIINSIQENNEKIQAGLKDAKLTKEEKKELKSLGIKLSDKEAVKAYRQRKADEAAAAEAEAAREAEEAAAKERAENPTTEDLLKQILVTLQAK